MDKVVIIGAFEFLGFHLCKKVLDDGIKVEGIHVAINEDALFIDEKRLEIGRNSNFSELDSHSMDFQSPTNEEFVLVIDYYDYFIRNCEKELHESFELIKTIKDANCKKVVYLLPISLLIENSPSILEEMMTLIRKKDIPIQTFYLPTVYGPWQPEEFLFQKAIISKDKEHKIGDREWTGDAIYVEDTVEVIIELMKEETEMLLLKSKERNSWIHCVQQLDLPHDNKVEDEIKFKGEEMTVEAAVSIQTGLENQKRLVQSLKLMGKLK